MDALSDFIRIVRSVDGEATARDVADMLWLAGHLEGASPSWRHLVEDEREAVSPEAGGSVAVAKTAPGEDAAASEPRPAAGEAGLHAATGPAAAGESGGEPFPAPTLPALPGRAELYRALWPLKCRVDSRVRTTMDIRATADFIAETGIPCPVLRPVKERWLDAMLVVEESPSMAVWRRSVRELHQVLVRSGIFRDVRIWRFARKADGREVRLHEGFSGPMPPGPGRHPSALVHPDGRRLILMISDAVSRAWHEGSVYRMAAHWQKGAATALVQMMPYWLWERTGLDRAISARLVAAAGQGDGNHRLQIAGPRRVLRALASKTKGEGLRTTAPKRLHLPVVMLSSDFLGPLADSISGRRYHRLPGVVYDEARFPAASPPAKGDAEARKPDPDPEKLVNGFRSTASHPARRLASFLAAAPLTLPIMRAVQGKMLPDSRQYHLAEVMLSGMVFRKPPRETWLPSDEIWYEFFPGVRERLLTESRRDETLDVLILVCDELSAFVDENTGRRESFRAVLAGGGGAGEGRLKVEHEPFAKVAALVLKRLGGRYTKTGEKITHSIEMSMDSDSLGVRGSGKGYLDSGNLRIFISYAKENIGIAKKIYNDLKSFDIEPWLDFYDLQVGQNWAETIEEAIKQSHFVLILLSSSLFKRKKQLMWFKKIVSTLKAISIKKTFILPVLIDKCEPELLLSDIEHRVLKSVNLFPSYSEGLNEMIRVFDIMIDFYNRDAMNSPSGVIGQNKGEGEPSKLQYNLRDNPVTTTDEEMRKIFHLNDNQRPIEYIQNEYQDNNDGTVIDWATGLMWQKSGSSRPVTYEHIGEYINKLNQGRYAGYADWRLPTVEELISLLEVEKKNDKLYIDPIFDKKQWCCRTSDKRPYEGEWLVYFNSGRVRRNNISMDPYIRLVRSL